MSRVASGDPAAQRQLATRVYGRASRLARSLLRSDADADDAAQVAMLEVLKSARTYRGDSSLERWADRVVARTTLRLAREKRASRIDADAEPDEACAPVAERDAAEDTPRAVEEYLRQLPESAREVLVLRHVLDCSVDEIADACGVSPNTVKDRLLRARETMRRMIRRDQAIGARAPLPAEAGRRGPEERS